MGKSSQQNQKNSARNVNNSIKTTTENGVTKVKRTRRSVPRDSPPQRSSIYRGVTRHRWTGRYEAHLWDKNCWNESQNKKGRQGAYDDEEAAAHAYDLAALKYWGPETILNFPLATYENELREMDAQSREEYIGSLRRKSSGFSRGVSKYRGVARHHHNGRWEARIGRVFGNKYLYLGTYATQEEAATAYDMAAIEYRGLNAVTNFDLSRYIKWLKPNQNDTNINPPNPNPNPNPASLPALINPIPSPNSDQDVGLNFLQIPNHQTYHHTSPSETTLLPAEPLRPTNATSALGLLLQSSKFKEMMEMTSMADCGLSLTVDELVPPQSTFPEDIQTFFETSNCYTEADDMIFGDLNSYVPQMFQYDF
ncbi:AP2-like ethylene-responsive transcription factor At1g16060 [Euphorbia peplus]|nr:AP2-like ethylene-responsive transcription factor At1g16060 [Euphorbia peplus]